ncbi:MAG TPA: VWA domain-containing protein [Pyrinomonadaceae bacterium]|jgi:VWFA-related protein
MKSPRTLKLAGVLLCLPLLYAAAAPAQQPPPQQPAPDRKDDEPEEVIRLETDLIQVRAVVTDRKGQPVDGLTREDFEVLEDGKPQQVSFFDVVRAPGREAEAAAAAAPAGKPNRAPPARTVVLLVDTLHLAPSNLVRAKRQMRKFVDEMMTDRDTVAVVSTSATLGILQQFTSDRKVLRLAIDRLQPFIGKAFTAYTAELAAAVLSGDEGAVGTALTILNDEEGYVPPTKEAGEDYVQARAREILAEEDRLRRVTLETIGAVAERLSKMKGQRLLAFVSNGFTYYDQLGGRDRLPLERAMGRAVRAGVAVYSLYGIGLYFNPHPLNGMPQQNAELTLRDFADETGGRAFINSNDLGSALQQMLDSNRVYYTLAYYPPKGGDPLKFRKITVRLKGHPEMSVRTQKGYLPPEPASEQRAATPRERLFKEVVAPLPATALDVTSAAYFVESEADDAQVTLQLHVGGEGLRYEERGEDRLLRCEVFAIVFDQKGQVTGTFAENISATLGPGQFAEARRKGYRYRRRLKLKPGLYQVRVGVREVGSELVGTASAWVEVPDLRRGRLEMSSLFLGAGDREAAAPRPLLERVTVKADEALSYRFVVYNAAGGSQPSEGADAQVKVEVLRGESEVYEGEWQPLSAQAIRRDAKGVEAGGRLKLGLPADLYTLRVTAKNPKSKKTVVQTADFEVAP